MSDNNDSFNKMISEFKSFEDLKKFSSAQHTTIIKMGKKLKELEEENRKLRAETKIAEASGTTPTPQNSNPIILNANISDEEIICLTQLSFLKQTSQDRELTLEEAKKVDIYNKILSGLKEKEKQNPGKPFEGASDEELLRLVKNE